MNTKKGNIISKPKKVKAKPKPKVNLLSEVSLLLPVREYQTIPYCVIQCFPDYKRPSVGVTEGFAGSVESLQNLMVEKMRQLLCGESEIPATFDAFHESISSDSYCEYPFWDFRAVVRGEWIVSSKCTDDQHPLHIDVIYEKARNLLLQSVPRE